MKESYVEGLSDSSGSHAAATGLSVTYLVLRQANPGRFVSSYFEKVLEMPRFLRIKG